MTKGTVNIQVSKETISIFCKKHHMKKLSFFGSVTRDDYTPSSDIDVLVEFENGFVPGFFSLFAMQEELSILLGGRKVDMRTPEDLSRYFREDVVNKAVVQYAAG